MEARASFDGACISERTGFFGKRTGPRLYDPAPGGAGRLSRPRSHPMCDYSLHAVTTRPAKAGETLITTTFRGTSTRGFASESEPEVAVCLLPGTELAFADNVAYDSRWFWTRRSAFRVGKLGEIDRHLPDRHHDTIEFPDGSHVLVTLLREGQH